MSLDDLNQLSYEQPRWFKNALTVPRTEHFVEVEGAEIHYFKWGDENKPGVVFTHGFMAHARCWAFIAPLLAEHYCLVAFDLSGMGDSDWRDVYNMDTRSRECIAVAEHAGLCNGQYKPALVAHSYGGGVALNCVEQFGEHWSALIICDMTMLAPDEPSEMEEFNERRQQRGVRPHQVYTDFETARARFRLAPEQPCANDFLVEYMAFHSLREIRPSDESRDGQREGVLWKFDPKILGPDSERDPDWWASVAPRFVALDIPKAIVRGQHSNMMSPAVITYLRDATQGQVPLVEIADAYHHIMLDQPIALAVTIDNLLQSLV